MNLIVAVDENYGIGCANSLLFNIKKDMRHFKELTTNNVVVMGSKTFYSLPGKHALRDRVNIVITSREEFNEPDTLVAHDLKELNEILQNFDTDDVFVIGGASIYRQLLPYCKRAYITKIKGALAADTYFENIDKLSNWALTESSAPMVEDGQKFSFCTYENSNVKNFERLERVR